MIPKSLSIPTLGYELKGDLYEAENPQYILIFFIGNGSNKASHRSLAPGVAKGTNSSAIVLDYSGHGESPFEFEDVSLAHNFMDVLSTFDYVKQQYPNTPVCVIGNSVGGFLAANLTKYRDFEKLVLRVPALYIPSIFYDPRSIYDWKRSNTYRNDPEQTSKHPIIRRPKLYTGKTAVVTHEHDDICPPATTDRFIEAFSADHWEIKDFVHGYGESKPSKEQESNYIQKIADWINKT